MNMSTARIVKRCCYFDLVAKIWKTDGVVTEVNNETEDGQSKIRQNDVKNTSA